jgi:hypothetical protein
VLFGAERPSAAEAESMPEHNRGSMFGGGIQQHPIAQRDRARRRLRRSDCSHGHDLSLAGSVISWGLRPRRFRPRYALANLGHLPIPSDLAMAQTPQGRQGVPVQISCSVGNLRDPIGWFCPSPSIHSEVSRQPSTLSGAVRSDGRKKQQVPLLRYSGFTVEIGDPGAGRAHPALRTRIGLTACGP